MTAMFAKKTTTKPKTATKAASVSKKPMARKAAARVAMVKADVTKTAPKTALVAGTSFVMPPKPAKAAAKQKPIPIFAGWEARASAEKVRDLAVACSDLSEGCID